MHYAQCSEGCKTLAVLELVCASLQIICGFPNHHKAFTCKACSLQTTFTPISNASCKVGLWHFCSDKNHHFNSSLWWVYCSDLWSGMQLYFTYMTLLGSCCIIQFPVNCRWGSIQRHARVAVNASQGRWHVIHLLKVLQNFQVRI